MGLNEAHLLTQAEYGYSGQNWGVHQVPEAVEANRKFQKTEGCSLW